MYKHLLLIRHAQAEYESSGLNDFDRPLTEKGHTEARTMSHSLQKRGVIIPNAIISSPAKRAISTARYFGQILNIDIQQEASIYESNLLTLLHFTNHLPNTLQCCTLIGHNPGLSELLYFFTHQPISLTTCGMVLIEFPFSQWEMLSAGTGKIRYYDNPNNQLV